MAITPLNKGAAANDNTGTNLRDGAQIINDNFEYLQTEQDNKVDKVTGYSLTKNDLTNLLKSAYDSAVTWIATNGAAVLNHLDNTTDAHGFLATIRGGVTGAGDDLAKLYALITQAFNDAKAYADSIATDVLRYAGKWDASTGTYPTSGTGSSGGVRRGDVFEISVAGTIDGQDFEKDDTLRSIVSNPGQIETNWVAGQVNSQQASETKIGIARVATQEEAIDALSDSLIMSPLKVEQKIISEKEYVNYQVAMTGETEQAIYMENAGQIYQVIGAGCNAIKLKRGINGTYPSGVQTYPFNYFPGDRIFFTFNYDDLLFAKCNIKFKCKDDFDYQPN